MRRSALILIAPAVALGLAACEPLPETAELTPSVAPTAAAPSGFNRAPRRGTPRRASPAGTFAPAPITATPILEDSVNENPRGIVPPPPPGQVSGNPLDPSIADAVEGGSEPVSPFPDPPVGTVPGGPLPDLQFADPTASALGVAPGAGLAAEQALANPPTGFGASAPVAVPAAVVPVAASAQAPTPTPTPAAAGLSDEQDFQAVTARETIESDAARLARLRATREVVAPQPVPARPDGAAPNIVSYAVAATNGVGQSVHSRSVLSGARQQRRACARFASPDRAQEAFLAAGGPRRDRYGLDPDGDGFACAWDPAPFRAAAY